MKLSIIIPAHNEENYIRHTLHSIKNQSFQDYEVLIVANGCTDKTEEIVKKKQSNKIKLISLSQPNVSIARNEGAKQARGELLFFLDADTTLDENALKTIKDEFQGMAVATTKVKPDTKEFKYQLAMSFKNLYNSKGIYNGCAGTLICRKDHFDLVGGYPEIVVKEHRKLTLDLLKYGKYGCINTYATTSMRRLKQWGLFGSTAYWLKQFLKDKFSEVDKDYSKVR